MNIKRQLGIVSFCIIKKPISNQSLYPCGRFEKESIHKEKKIIDFLYANCRCFKAYSFFHIEYYRMSPSILPEKYKRVKSVFRKIV